ncbi:MAG: hypothetical protein KKD36_09045 [Bacteroidetes bacterium]|nr:hypothetical protein [Bacteroidota bacterium]
MSKINVSYLVSYDYEYLFTSLKCIYNSVDQIVISIDKERKTWSGNTYSIDESFFKNINQFDDRKIIEIYEDNFFVPDLSPMECETRQRNLTLKKLKRGWKIQLDVDEYMYDFDYVKQFLKKYWYLTLFPKMTPIGFIGRLVTLFKIENNKYFFIDNNEYFPFITNQNFNTKTRNNNGVFKYISGIVVIHQSWGREEQEIYTKINNWGHRDDFDTLQYFDLWKKLNESNFSSYKNFHPLSPEAWDKLEYMEAKSIDDFIFSYAKINPFEVIELDVINYFKSLIYKKIKN